MLVLPTIFNFWHSGALVLRTERQSAQMSKIKNGVLDQYGIESFEQEQFDIAGVKGVNLGIRLWRKVGLLLGPSRGAKYCDQPVCLCVCLFFVR